MRFKDMAKYFQSPPGIIFQLLLLSITLPIILSTGVIKLESSKMKKLTPEECIEEYSNDSGKRKKCLNLHGYTEKRTMITTLEKVS